MTYTRIFVNMGAIFADLHPQHEIYNELWAAKLCQWTNYANLSCCFLYCTNPALTESMGAAQHASQTTRTAGLIYWRVSLSCRPLSLDRPFSYMQNCSGRNSNHLPLLCSTHNRLKNIFAFKKPQKTHNRWRCSAVLRQDSNGNIVSIFEVSIQSNIQSDYYLFRTWPNFNNKSPHGIWK